MGTELNRNQPLADEIKRILTEQADEGLGILRELYGTDPAAAVHQLRKLLRRMRGMVRLVRPALGDAAWSQENFALRDLGRQLAPVRDAVVMRQTLSRILADDFETAATLQRMLPEPGAVVLPPLDEVTLVLEGVRERVAAWPLAGNKWSLVGPGLEATYRAGRRAYQQALRGPGEETLHEWRKRAKELRCQLETLVPAQGKSQVKGLKRLCGLLGEVNDLSVLRKPLGALGSGPVLERIDQQREALRKQIEELGRELYGEKPARFAGRVEGWWKG